MCVDSTVVRGCRSLVFDIYCSFNILVCVWLGHGVGHSWLQDGWQNSCLAMFNALISSLVGVL